MHPVQIIQRKRDGHELTPEQIREFIGGVVRGEVSEARTASLLMAIFLRGLTPAELAALTLTMRDSGEVFDSSTLGRPAIDKHSTGGVGDKTSLLIAPIAAAAGLAVPMISGRSLGHTGGTLDKLETIPGFRTQLSLSEFGDVVRQCGNGMIGQTENLVPADRILYALRDHTGTVESPNLICASIMSKKLAAGLNGLVLDVKTGSGAFLRDETEALHLATLMVETGERAGTRTVALMTRMDEPLGRFAGNWCEVRECVEILQGKVHPLSADLVELSLALAAHMLLLGGVAGDYAAAHTRAEDLLRSGSAYEHWLHMVQLQGGDVKAFEHMDQLHVPAAQRTLHAEANGWLGEMDATEVGWAIQRLGAGRDRPGGPVSAAAGLEMHAKVGDAVQKGQPLVTIFADTLDLLEEPERMLRAQLRVVPDRPDRPALIKRVLTVANAGSPLQPHA